MTGHSHLARRSKRPKTHRDPTFKLRRSPPHDPLDKFNEFTYCSGRSFSSLPSPPPAVVRAYALLRGPPPIRVNNTHDPANFGELWAPHRCPNSFSISPWPLACNSCAKTFGQSRMTTLDGQRFVKERPQSHRVRNDRYGRIVGEGLSRS